MARLTLFVIALGIFFVNCIDSSRYHQSVIDIGDNSFGEINNGLVRSIEKNNNLIDFTQNFPSYDQSINSIIQPRIQATPSQPTRIYTLGKRVNGK